MPNSSVAVLFDAGYLWRNWPRILNRDSTPQDIIDLSHALVNKDEKLFRVFFYDCPPFDGERFHPVTQKKIDYRTTDMSKKRLAFLQELSTRDNIAFRRGRLSHKGWALSNNAHERLIKKLKKECLAQPDTPGDQEEKDQELKLEHTDIQPVFSQKAVDMKIGLDVAWLSSKSIVGTIILFGCDTDYVPAMKHARREGCRVSIACFPNKYKPSRPDLHPELMEHADECRLIQYEGGTFVQAPLHWDGI